MPPFGNVGPSSWLVLPLIVGQILQGVLCGFACLSNPCVHGVCLDDLNTTYSCYCIDGFTGVQCQTNWDECWSSPCQNGGVCIDGIASFNCSCAPGFVGDLCEEDFNECDSNPCLNNGTCLDATNGYTCTCLPGYSGTHCEIDEAVCNITNETRCSNGGICVEGPGITFTCKCQPGWGGFLCDTEIDECMSAPCVNGAVCIDLHADYACACLFGYAGRNCEEVVRMCEDNPCKNSALCLKEDEKSVCYCVPDYHGELCQYQYDECQLGHRCLNGGTCIDGIDNFTCSCPPNLTGVLCECLIIGPNEQDCSYISPSPATFKYTSTFTTNSISTKFTTQVSSNLTTFETTKVPKTTEPLITETSMIPTTTSLLETTEFVQEYTTIPPTGFLNTTTELITATSSKDFIVTTTLVQEPRSATEEEYTTIPSVTTKQPVSVSTVRETAASSNEYSTKVYTTEVTAREITLSKTTGGEFITISTASVPFTIAPNVTFTTTSASETTSYFPYSEEVTLMASITPFLTEEPGMSSPIVSTIGSTTLSDENVTTIDCTKAENQCQNGGTCIFSNEVYKCICPFAVEGTFCEIHLGVRNAAFGGDSFLSHRLPNNANTSVEFKAQTLSTNGMIFYSSVDLTYMTLFIEEGYLKFKFSCGFQTMLLSELGVPVNTGFEMRIKARLNFSKDQKKCYASIRLNETLSMSGDQIAVIDRLVKPESWLHLGGVPQEMNKNSIDYGGFVGCLSNLRISGKSVNVFKDAEDGFHINECSSLVCLSNPCANGATCAAEGDSWSCHCRNGYLGKMCETSVCDNNPCLYGGTCLPFATNGYICLCPFGKHGHFCENDLEITEPNFSSSVKGLSSYAAYPIPSGISKTMELQFKFFPSVMDQISILVFLGQQGHHDMFSDHMAVSFVKGYIMLTWNLGSGPRRIFTNRPIPKGKTSYSVRLGHMGRKAWLYVEDLGNVTGRSPGALQQLDVVPLLYLGGHDSFNFSSLPHDLPLHAGFAGCIFDVQLKSGAIAVPLQVTKHVVGRAVGQCGTMECYDQVCHNNGACLHHGSTFMCLCQDSWFGPLCTNRRNPCDSYSQECSPGSTCFPLITGYECDCPLGKIGKRCESYENLTDVSFSGRRSFISLGSLTIEPSQFTIEFHLRPLSDKGLILFLGKKSSFLLIVLHSGFVELIVLAVKRRVTSHEAVSVKSNKLLAVGMWYKVQIGVYGRKLYLSVDNVISTGLLGSGDTLTVSGELLYLGGLPDLSFLSEFPFASLPIPFTGCMRSVYVNSQHIPLDAVNIKSSRNIADCDGTPCGGDFCENGGSCLLDSALNPLCLCPEPFQGLRCEKTPDCNGQSCLNGGRCLNSRCICTVGYSGAFCETSIEVTMPRFKGSSYLVVKSGSEKKRDLKDFYVRSVYLNFSTPQKNGLLLWSSKDKNYLGVASERGYLKIAYASNGTGENVVELPNVGQISDGLWHTMKLNFNPFYLELDNNAVMAQGRDSFIPSAQIYTDGRFFLGGINEDNSTVTEGRGIFSNPFQGCIQAFGINDEKLITNFSGYEGENVDVCGNY